MESPDNIVFLHFVNLPCIVMSFTSYNTVNSDVYTLFINRHTAYGLRLVLVTKTVDREYISRRGREDQLVYLVHVEI